jgi:uncharacterized protein YggE
LTGWKGLKGMINVKVSLLCLGLVAGPALAGDTHAVPGPVISVSGSAATSVKPDLLRIRFGVETREASSRAAVAANAELMDSVIGAVRGAGVDEDEISTTQFNVQAVYDTVPDPDTGRRSPVLSGYQVSNVLLVETPDLDKAAAILDGATAAGANRVDGVDFALAPETQKAVQDDLIELAVLDARGRAEKALEPLGQVITGVQNVSLSGTAAPLHRAADTAMLEMARAAPTQVFASDQDVSVSVHVTFFIGGRP